MFRSIYLKSLSLSAARSLWIRTDTSFSINSSNTVFTLYLDSVYKYCIYQTILHHFGLHPTTNDRREDWSPYFNNDTALLFGFIETSQQSWILIDLFHVGQSHDGRMEDTNSQWSVQQQYTRSSPPNSSRWRQEYEYHSHNNCRYEEEAWSESRLHPWRRPSSPHSRSKNSPFIESIYSVDIAHNGFGEFSIDVSLVLRVLLQQDDRNLVLGKTAVDVLVCDVDDHIPESILDNDIVINRVEELHVAIGEEVDDDLLWDCQLTDALDRIVKIEVLYIGGNTFFDSDDCWICILRRNNLVQRRSYNREDKLGRLGYDIINLLSIVCYLIIKRERRTQIRNKKRSFSLVMVSTDSEWWLQKIRMHETYMNKVIFVLSWCEQNFPHLSCQYFLEQQQSGRGTRWSLQAPSRHSSLVWYDENFHHLLLLLLKGQFHWQNPGCFGRYGSNQSDSLLLFL